MQRFSQSRHAVKRNIDIGAFNQADVIDMKAGKFGKLFLRNCLFLAFFTQTGRKSFADFVSVFRHRQKLEVRLG